MAAGVSPPLEERIEDDQHGKRNSLVEKNCADRLMQLHGVHLPEDRRSGKGTHMRSRLLPNLLRVGFWESLL